MKTAFLVLGIPVFVFTVLAIGVDLGPIVPLYSDQDLTPYLAAVSLGRDRDLAYSREDSDRFFQDQLRRPSPFQVVRKKILSSSGQYTSYYAFYQPDLYVFFLVPFVSFFSFHGFLLSQVLLLAAVYWTGFLYYGIRREGGNKAGTAPESILPSLNSLVYHTLVPLPVIFLLPSHHLFLYASVFLALYAHLKRRVVLSAILLAIAASSQPLAILVGILCISYWQGRKETKEGEARPSFWLFTVVLVASCFAVWGIERLMYPPGAVSEVRWVNEAHHRPLSELWQQLPVLDSSFWDRPSGQRLVDFLFGRNTGLFVYGFPACALLLTSIWVWKDPLVKSGLMFVAFFLLVLSFTNPEGWNLLSFTNDHWSILCSIAFFFLPLIQPFWQGVAIIVPSLFLAAPLLVNALGAHTSRLYYVQSFPYKYFPVEVTLTGRTGILKNPSYSLPFSQGTFYFLNDHFYKESDFFWVRGNATLELLLQQDRGDRHPAIEIQNGALDNEIVIHLGNRKQRFTLTPSQIINLDLNALGLKWKTVGRSEYLHGTIESKNGYVPKLFTRDNPDYRFLGCRVRPD